MPFSFFIALRYLQPKRTFVSIMTLLSVIGVCLGVTVLMVVIAVMAGFEKRIKDTVLGFEPHVTLETQFIGMLDEDGFPIGNGWEDLVERLEGLETVTAVSPYVQTPAFLQIGGDPTSAAAIGFRADDAWRLEQLEKLNPEGTVDLSGDSIVVGSSIANNFGLAIGDKITVVSPHSLRDLVEAAQKSQEARKRGDEEAALKAMEDVSDEAVLPLELEIGAIFSSLQYGDIIILPLHHAQHIAGLEESVNGIGVVTENAYRAGEYVDGILQVTPPEWRATTWMERHEQWFNAVAMERTMMYFVLFIILFVAGFSIMVTMITVTVQKRQDIGVIGALGGHVNQIAWIFLAQGMVVGVIGIICGLGLGGLILQQRNNIREGIQKLTNFQIFDSGVYGLVEIPARILPKDLIIISIGAFVLCTLAALIPALFAARVDPAKALRNL